MDADGVQITSGPPGDCGPERVIRFFPDYSAEHPLWFTVGYPKLADLHLAADLTERLRRWSAYWDDTFDPVDGWPDGTPASWWPQEEALLPRDVALAFGSEFVIEADGRFLRSTVAPGSVATVRVMNELIRADADERAHIEWELAKGVRYDIVAGDITYTTWLAAHPWEDG